MPTYVYQCQDCEDQIEVLQSFNDAPLEVCARCGGELRRVFFPPAIVFKGSGWYCTDHRKSSTAGNGSNLKSKEPVTKEASVGEGEE